MTHASVIVNSYNVPTLFSRQSLGNRIAVLDICTQWYLPGTAALEIASLADLAASVSFWLEVKQATNQKLHPCDN